MFEESITIDTPLEETREIIKDLITKRFGTIVNEGSRHISWEIGSEPKIIKCITYLEKAKDFTKVITEYSTDDFWKSEAKQTIKKFYTFLIQNHKPNIPKKEKSTPNTLSQKRKKKALKNKPKDKEKINEKRLGRIVKASLITIVILYITFTYGPRIAETISNNNNSNYYLIENIVDFELYEYDIIPNIKYSANIRLKKEISKSELETLAKHIYRKYNLSSYERSFLVYYLPGMTFGAGGWATTHYNPNLEVRIFGKY